jgi:hypothetical protein
MSGVSAHPHQTLERFCEQIVALVDTRTSQNALNSRVFPIPTADFRLDKFARTSVQLRPDKGSKKPLQPAPIGGRKRGEELLLRASRGLGCAREHALSLRGRMEGVGAAVARIAPTLHVPRALELVHHGDHGRSVDALPLAEALLRHRSVLRQQDQRAEALPAQAERRQRALRDRPVLQMRASEQVSKLISYTDVQYC